MLNDGVIQKSDFREGDRKVCTESRSNCSFQPKEDTILSRPTEFDRLPATFSKASHSENGELLFSASKKQAEKVVWFLIGVNGPSARRMDGRLHIGVSWSISPQPVSALSHWDECLE